MNKKLDLKYKYHKSSLISYDFSIILIYNYVILD